MSSRIEKIKDVIKEKKLDGILITDMFNVRYLSNFTGSNAQLLITLDDNFFFTDGRYELQSKKEVKNFKIEVDKEYTFERVSRLLKDKPAKKIGFEDENIIYNAYRILKKFSKKECYPISKHLESLRVIKDENELKLIKKAIKISEEALLEVKKKIKPGVKEIDLAIEFETIARHKGAEDLAFDTLIESGSRSAFVHGEASNKKIKEGDLVYIDFGCLYKGYRSDQTVTYGVGKLSPKAIKIYNTVKEAQRLALESIKPGVKISKPVNIVNDYFKSKGYNSLVHSLGHGIGLEMHERPYISPISKGSFKEGMVFSIEPGIYINKFGGVRIEDLVVVTKNGYKLLTNLPKDLEIL